MSSFQPPPTWALPILVDERTSLAIFNPVWLKWFVDLTAALPASGAGSVSSVSVVSANGLAGTVATATTTPAITLSTTVTGLLKGNGTAISAAVSGTDYAPATSGTSILYGNGAGGFSNVTIGTGVAFAAGTLSATGSGGTVTSVTGTAPVVSSGGTTPAISMAAATTSVNGYLTSTDWTTFNNKGSGTVTSVTGTAPVVSSGGAAPAISMAAATTSVNGYLTSTDWTTFNNKGSGTITSVSGTAGRITSTGGATPVIDLASGVASAGTTGSASLIPVVTIDTYGRVTSITTAANPQGTVTSVSFTGGVITVATPTTTPALTIAGTSGGIPYFSSASTWATSAALAAGSLVQGGGAGVAPSTITTGTGVVTALGVNTGTAGAFVVNGGALGTPSSGTATNLTGTASININGTVGATTPNTGAFTNVGVSQSNVGGRAFYVEYNSSNLGVGIITRNATGEALLAWNAKAVASSDTAQYVVTGGGAARILVGFGANTMQFGLANATGTAGNNITFVSPLLLSTTGAAITGTGSVTTGFAVGGATAGAGGIAFPATAVAVADANTLDDYEEGTWTPTLTPATSGTITLGSPNACGYTKIGRLVTVNGLIDTASVSSPIGASVTFNNLPFASNATGTQRSAGTAIGFALSSGTVIGASAIVSSTTSFVVYINASLFQLGSQVYFQLTYTV